MKLILAALVAFLLLGPSIDYKPSPTPPGQQTWWQARLHKALRWVVYLTVKDEFKKGPPT